MTEPRRADKLPPVTMPLPVAASSPEPRTSAAEPPLLGNLVVAQMMTAGTPPMSTSMSTLGNQTVLTSLADVGAPGMSMAPPEMSVAPPETSVAPPEMSVALPALPVAPPAMSVAPPEMSVAPPAPPAPPTSKPAAEPPAVTAAKQSAKPETVTPAPPAAPAAAPAANAPVAAKPPPPRPTPPPAPASPIAPSAPASAKPQPAGKAELVKAAAPGAPAAAPGAAAPAVVKPGAPPAPSAPLPEGKSAAPAGKKAGTGAAMMQAADAGAGDVKAPPPRVTGAGGEPAVGGGGAAGGGPGGAAGGGGGDAAAAVDTWSTKVVGAANAIPKSRVTAGDRPAALKSAGKAARQREDKHRGEIPGGAKGRQPAPPVVEERKPADDLIPDATAALTAAAGKTLDKQIVPALVASPRGTMPVLGARPVDQKDFRALLDPSLVAIANAPDKVDAERRRLAELKDRLLAPPVAAGETAPPPAPTVLEDRGPPPPPRFPAGLASGIGDVVARLLADPGGEARKIAEDVRDAAYPQTVLRTAFPAIADEFIPELTTSLDQQLRSIAGHAGVTDEDLQRRVKLRQDEIARQSQEASAQVCSAENDARAIMSSEADATRMSIASAQQSLVDDAERKGQAAMQAAAPTGPEARRDRYIDWVTQLAAKEVTRYRLAAEQRKAELDRHEALQAAAYKLVGQQDELAVRETAPKGQPVPADVALKAQEAANWARAEIAATHTAFEGLRKKASTQAADHSSAILLAADGAKQRARDWSDKETGTTTGWFSALIQRIRDWRAQAEANAAAWAEVENGRTAVSLAGDLADAAAIAKAAQQGVTRESMLANQTLTQAQRLIIDAYFKGGPAGDMIGAVAASLHAKIAGERFSEISGRFETKLLATPVGESDNLDRVAGAQGKLMMPAAIKIHGALDHWFHFRMDTGTVFAELSGLTRIQAGSVRLCYRARGWGSLDEQIDSKLNGPLGNQDELVRAEAQLSGDQGLADAAAFEASIHWYGNDTDGMMAALRQKTPEERDRLLDAYKKHYGVDLRARLGDQLSGLQKERGEALLDLQTDKADAIGLRLALPLTREQPPEGEQLYLGNRKKVEAIYQTITSEVQERGAKENWTPEEIEAEINLRKQKVEASFDKRFGKDYERPESGALRTAFAYNLKPGATQDFVNALASNDLAGLDAARVKMEHDGAVASDDVINNTLESQFQRALDDERRAVGQELHDRMEDELQAKFDADKKAAKDAGKPWNDYDEQRKRRLDMESDFEDRLAARARERADRNMSALEKKFAGNYKLRLKDVVSSDTQWTGHKKAMKLLEQRGYLTEAQHVYFATKGAGTSDPELDKAIKGRTRTKLATMRKDYKDEFGRDMDEDIADDSSGREYYDRMKWLRGEPETAREQLAQLKRDLVYEQLTGGELAGEEMKWLREQVAKAQKQCDILYDPNATEEQKQAAGKSFDQFASYAQAGVEDHRRAVDSMTDTITMIAAIVVSVAVTALTFGAAGPVMAAVWGSIAATATTMLLKAAIKGPAYGLEEFGTDVAIGVVDAAMAGLTAGLSGKMLGQAAHAAGEVAVEAGEQVAKTTARKAGQGAIARAMPTVDWMAQAMKSNNVFKKNFARVLAHGAEAIIQGTPSAFVGNVLNDRNWESGDALSNILLGTIEQSASNLAFAFAMQAGHAVGARGWKSIRRTPGGGAAFERGRGPVERPIEFSERARSEPEASYAEWLSRKDEAALRRRAEAAPADSPTADHASAERLKELAEGLSDPAMRKRVPVEVDANLDGRTVKVEFTRRLGGLGDVTVRCGPDALPSDVALHLDTVRAVEAYGGLGGRVRVLLERLRAWRSNNEVPRPFSRAWRAQLELDKLHGIVEFRLAILELHPVPPEARAHIDADIAHLQKQIAEHDATLQRMDRNPAEGFIAAFDRPAGEKAGAPGAKEAIPVEKEVAPAVKEAAPAAREAAPAAREAAPAAKETMAAPKEAEPAVKEAVPAAKEAAPAAKEAAPAAKEAAPAAKEAARANRPINDIQEELAAVQASGDQSAKAKTRQARLARAMEMYPSLRGKPVPEGHYFYHEPGTGELQLKRDPGVSKHADRMVVVELKEKGPNGEKIHRYVDERNAAAIREGYPDPPEGHRWIKDGDKFQLRRLPEAEVTELRWDHELNRPVEYTDKAKSWTESKASAAKDTIAPSKKSPIPELENALADRVAPRDPEAKPWTREDAGLVRRWEDAIHKLAEKSGAEPRALVEELLSGMKGDYSEGAYRNFRKAIREKMLDTVMKRGSAKERIELLRDFMKQLPDQGGSVGSLFSEFRVRAIADVEAVESIKLDRKSVYDPNKVIEASRRPEDGKSRLNRDVDGACRVHEDVKDGPKEGTYAIDDKAGKEPFDLQQAKDYSAMLESTDGLRTSEKGPVYDGLIYFFENPTAAQNAMKRIDAANLSRKIHVAYFSPEGTLQWVKR